MKAWQFATAAGGIENNLFVPATGAPKPTISDDQILVEVYSVALNPADYKTAEAWFLAKTVVPSPKVPCTDFCGKVVETGNKIDSFKIGEMVFGACDPLKSGSLGQYVAVSRNMLASMPEGLDVDDAASIGVAGLTAYKSLKEKIKQGDKVFINGGSGGCGVFGMLFKMLYYMFSRRMRLMAVCATLHYCVATSFLFIFLFIGYLRAALTSHS